MNWFRILAGIVLLAAGRRLFWLLVGVLGLIWGVRAATHFFPGQPEWMVFAMALAAGILGALLALFFQWLAIGLAGFSVGAYIVLRLLHVSGWKAGGIEWVLLLIGGVLGALLMILVFDWALIILSSLAGAGLITESLYAEQGSGTLLFVGLFIVGVLLQFRLMKRT